MIRTPAFVDLHVHFRDPGFPEKEDIFSGAAAAEAGGYSYVCMLPNTAPAIDSAEVLLAADEKGRRTSVNVFAYSALTKGQKGLEPVNFEEMNAAPTRCRELIGHGVCGLSEDGKTLADEGLMKQVCSEAVRLNLPIMDHCEPEEKIVARDIRFAKKTGARFHLQHISLAESVALLREAKREGVNITCETAPHYFALSKEFFDGNIPPNAKMNPPLRSEKDRLAIIEGICDGTIDCIATDHAPHEAAAKAGSFAEAANGIIGLETAFPIAYTALVQGGYISFEKLIELMSERPAEIIGLPKEKIGTVLLDLDTEYKINAEGFCSRSRNTPFGGFEVRGRAVGLQND